ncbi:MAG: phage tail protein [Acetobacteraceae bacterium]|nr:phage tail protein [Acetobacteraceae bacterium]
MPIVQSGTLNTTALVVPDLYVQIVPPQNLVVNGVPTNIVGMVGSSSWGPANRPVIVSSMSDYARAFGPIQARRFDMGTHVATAVQQGAQNFRCVRVTDGTDTAATYAFFYGSSGYPALLTACYTGTLGNQVGVQLTPGSAAGTWRLTLGLPGQVAENFDNIAAPTPGAFWQNLVNAVNLGQGPLRGPSALCVATLGAAVGTNPAVLMGQSLLNGTDGASGVSTAHVIGADGAPRRGMYALRGQGCSIMVLADTDEAATWTVQAGFAQQEGLYVILTGPSGDTINTAIAAKQGAGLDSYSAKLMFGDWVWWSDPVAGTIRLVSPQGFVAGRLSNLSPEQSSLNKPLYGVVGTQRAGSPGSGSSNSYSTAELTALLGVGIDVICNPQPAGSFWGVRGGHNSSSNAATNGDNYTRLTNFIAETLSAGMGQYVGQVINASLFRRIRSTQLSFLQNMLGQGVLGSANGAQPFNVICDLTNNPPSRTSLGYVQSDAQIQYQAINERFIVNLEGGQTVQVTRQTLPYGQIS